MLRMSPRTIASEAMYCEAGNASDGVGSAWLVRRSDSSTVGDTSPGRCVSRLVELVRRSIVGITRSRIVEFRNIFNYAVTEMTVVGQGVADGYLTSEQIETVAREGLGALPVDGRRVLVIIPDGTRTMPMP